MEVQSKQAASGLKSAKKKRFMPKLQIGESHVQPDFNLSTENTQSSSNYMMPPGKRQVDSHFDGSVGSQASINTIPV